MSKIKRLLGFEPKISFEEGIAQFTKWVNQQTVVPSKYDDSVAEMKAKGLMK
jgi:dTDP-L-rhamnose 4-epimerase